jgi:hypothetical protein
MIPFRAAIPFALVPFALIVSSAGQTLSPLCVYNDLVNRYKRDFYSFGATSQNVTTPRIIQLALKFYF